MIVGIDSGGTFTDIVVIFNGCLDYFKIPSTPKRPAEALVQALNIVQEKYKVHVGKIVHGTTIATNALLERKGVKIAFITNAGFEDVLRIGRQNRSELYNLYPKERSILVPRDAIFGLKQRSNSAGQELAIPEIDDLTELIDWIEAQQPQAIAIGFLHSPINPEPEESISLLIKELGIPVCYSAEVDPVPCEYERFSTATANAYLLPLVDAYMTDLQASIDCDNLMIQQSNGGLSPSSFASKMPIRLLLSGPAGGVAALNVLSKLLGVPKLIGFDMGGTSTDVSLFDNGMQYRESIDIDGIPIRIPTLDIQTVGSGGGSIAWIDSGTALKVGPQSSGANPGPACYKKGGPFCTTDANLVLGRIPREIELPEIGQLDYIASVKAAKPLAERLNLSTDQIAAGVVAIANVVMSRAIRKVSQECGKDPAEYTLVAFGGAGGLHACELADLLNIKKVLIPYRAGVLSALGMAMSAPKLDFMQHCGKYIEPDQNISQLILDDYLNLINFATNQAYEYKIEPKLIEVRVKCKYPQQMFTLELPWSVTLAEDFTQRHMDKYGFSLDNTPVEVVTLMVSISGETPNLEIPKILEKSKIEKINNMFVWESLPTGFEIKGAATIGQSGATAFIPEHWIGRIDDFRNLLLEPCNEV